MTAQTRLYTAEELWEISHSDTAKRYELYEGELVEMSPTGDSHGITTNWVAYLITGFVEAHDLGEVAGAETGFILFAEPYTVVGADIAFIAKARLTPMTGKYYPLAPNMAVE